MGITAIEFAELQPPMFDLHPMRALFLMSKSGFKPPQLKDKNKWSQVFQHFIKVALTKNPKKRPTADKLLEHPFVLSDHLSRNSTRELLDRVHNPTSPGDFDLQEDDDGVLQNVPRRISSQNSSQSSAARNSLEFQVNIPTEHDGDFKTAHSYLDDPVSEMGHENQMSVPAEDIPLSEQSTLQIKPPPRLPKPLPQLPKDDKPEDDGSPRFDDHVRT